MEEHTQYTGLTDSQVLESRARYGINIMTVPPQSPWWKLFLEKFKDPLIIILLVAGLLSVGISFYEFFVLHQGGRVFFEPTGIFVAILLATGLAFYFEQKAGNEFALLNHVNDDEPVKLYRNGQITQVARKEIVVGDVVILETGEEVPADGELLESSSLHVDESSLTGEPVCLKSAESSDFDPNATYPTNHLMKGTKLMEGHCVMKIMSVGDHSEQGKVYHAVQIDDSVKTPLNEQLDRL